MKTTTITRAAISGVLVLLAGAGIACTKADASSFDSAYCHVARRMITNEIKPADKTDPSPDQTSWLQYSAFLDDGLHTAPNAIHADWVVYYASASKQAPVVAKYGYSEDRFNADATDADKAVMNPGPKADAAFHRILNYEAYTCGSSQPPAAKVSFKSEKAGAYCDAIAEDSKNTASLEFGDPASVRLFRTDPAKVKQGLASDARLVATAPKVIRDDVKAEVNWWNTKQKPVQAKYDYDMVKLMLHGSEKDVQALQLTDKKVANHFARALAYEQQVCGSES